MWKMRLQRPTVFPVCDVEGPRAEGAAWGMHMKRLRWALQFLALLLPTQPLLPQGNPADSVSVHSTRKSKRTSPKDNIDAIGTRNIGGKGFGNWYSAPQERSMGLEYSRLIEENTRIVADPVISEYVNRVAQSIARNSDLKEPLTVKVIDSEEVNAFALPGGFLYVNTGLLTAVEDEAELAGVIAHEIAHVAAHHAARQMTRSQMFQLASVPLIFVGGGLGVALQEAAALGAPAGLTKFSRGFEAEADYLGVEYLYKAGYDPQAFVVFCERFQGMDKHKTNPIGRMFSSHPQMLDRIRKTQAEISKILPPREAYLLSTSDFDTAKVQLSKLAVRGRPNQGQADLPTLRRSTQNQDESTSDDQHPKLKRRPDSTPPSPSPTSVDQ